MSTARQGWERCNKLKHGVELYLLSTVLQHMPAAVMSVVHAVVSRHVVGVPVRGLEANDSLQPGAPNDHQGELLQGEPVLPAPQSP